MWTAKFWKDALERAIKTTAQVLVGSVAAINVVEGSMDWQLVATTTGIAAGLSFLTSLLSSLAGSSDNASVVE